MNNAKTTRVTTGQTPPHAHRAAQVIEGEQRAVAFFDRIQSGMAQPDELAVIVAFCTRRQKPCSSSPCR